MQLDRVKRGLRVSPQDIPAVPLTAMHAITVMLVRRHIDVTLLSSMRHTYTPKDLYGILHQARSVAACLVTWWCSGSPVGRSPACQELRGTAASHEVLACPAATWEAVAWLQKHTT